MRKPDAPARDPLLIVPDCNVLIHAKALSELPWQDIFVGDVEIVIVGPVLRELDQVKRRPGRPGRLARDMGSDLRELLERPDFSDVIRQTRPRVTRRLWLGQREGREYPREGLDVTHGDQAIINCGLWLLDNGSRVVFLTDDTLAAVQAKEFGLPCQLLPREWLRPAENDETQKENSRLKSEIARLTASEPQPRGWFEDLEGNKIDRIDIILKRFQPLSSETIKALMERVETASPMAQITRRPASKISGGSVDIATINEQVSYAVGTLMEFAIARYEEEHAAWLGKVRQRLETLHIAWRHRQKWPGASFVAQNAGSRPASGTLVEIIAAGNFQIMRPRAWKGEAAQIDGKRRLAEMSIQMPPVPPSASDTMAKLFGTDNGPVGLERPRLVDPLRGLNDKRESDAFYWRTGRTDASDRMELECETWRHQRPPQIFKFLVAGSDAEPISGAVTGRISACNLATPVEVRLPIRLSFVDRPMDSIANEMVSEFESVVAGWRRARSLPPIGK